MNDRNYISSILYIANGVLCLLAKPLAKPLVKQTLDSVVEIDTYHVQQGDYTGTITSLFSSASDMGKLLSFISNSLQIIGFMMIVIGIWKLIRMFIFGSKPSASCIPSACCIWTYVVKKGKLDRIQIEFHQPESESYVDQIKKHITEPTENINKKYSNFADDDGKLREKMLQIWESYTPEIESMFEGIHAWAKDFEKEVKLGEDATKSKMETIEKNYPLFDDLMGKITRDMDKCIEEERKYEQDYADAMHELGQKEEKDYFREFKEVKSLNTLDELKKKYDE